MKLPVLFVAMVASLTLQASGPAALFTTEAEEQLVSYRGSQRIEGGGVGFTAWLEAETEFPVHGKMVARIKSQGGKQEILNEALQPFLEGQTKGIPETSAFTAENYAVGKMLREKEGLVPVQIRPLRKEISLLEGLAFFHKNTFDLVRMEGKPAKDPNPKVWNEHVVKEYARISGVRVPVKITITGLYRAGWFVPVPSRIVVTCRYDEINGRKVQ